MTDEIREIIIPAVLILLGAGVTAGVSVAAWGIKRVVQKQDETCKSLADGIKETNKELSEGMKETNDTLKDIRDDLAANVARVSILETKEKIREERNQERHLENQRAIEGQSKVFERAVEGFEKQCGKMWAAIGKMKER